MTQSLRGSKRSARRIAILNPRIINLFQRVQVFGVPPWKNKIAKADITALPEVRGAVRVRDVLVIVHKALPPEQRDQTKPRP